MNYCCPADPEKKKEWEEHMLREIDFLEHDIKKASEIFSALWTPYEIENCLFSLSKRSLCLRTDI